MQVGRSLNQLPSLMYCSSISAHIAVYICILMRCLNGKLLGEHMFT